MAEPKIDFAELFSFVCRQPSAVHRKPTNEYMNYVNVYLFNTWKLGCRETILKEGQVKWKNSSAETRANLYRLALMKMEKIKRGKRTITDLFNAQKNAAPTQNKKVNDSPNIEEPKFVSIPPNTTAPEALSHPGTAEQHILEGQLGIAAYLCQNLGISFASLFTPDVKSHKEFMRALSCVAASYKDYNILKQQYDNGSHFSKSGSKVQLALQVANDLIKKLCENLVELSSIRVITTDLSVQLKSCQQKLTKMMELLPILFDTKDALETSIPVIQACIRAQKQRKFDKLTGQKQYKLLSSNNLGLSWDDAIEKIANLMDTGATFSPLSAEQLLCFPVIKDSIHHIGLCGIPSEAIAKHYKLSHEEDIFDIVCQILDHFPVLCIKKGQKCVLVDYTELHFYPGIVFDLLSIDWEKTDNSDDKVLEEDTASEAPEGVFMYKKRGPIPKQKQYPELLNTMMEFIRLHGFAAHIRRREGTGTSCGVTLEDIRQHVLKHVDGLTNISRSKIYNLLKPARKNTAEAARHQDCLDVRVGVKTCDISKEHPYAHEYFASVRNIREISELFKDECTVMSCDSKAKVHIGGQAVSRYHQLRVFFPDEDKPHFKDHDFPLGGYLIEPDGYLILQHENDGPPEKITDKLDRETVKLPATGPLFIYNRCVNNTSTSIQDHVNDLNDIFEKNPTLKKPVLSLVTDGGPDWTPKSNINEFFLGRFWRDHKLDMLVSVCMPPGLSRFNPIEHLWSSCSRWLAGVQLPDCLPGENIPPPLQSNLSAKDREAKECKVFDNALERLDMYWHGKIHDGFKVSSTGMTSSKEDYRKVYSDYEHVKTMFDSSLRVINESEELSALLGEWKFFSRHMDRRCGLVIFKKLSCEDAGCSCHNLGDVSAKNVWKLPNSKQWFLPPITPDPKNPGHYKTIQQLIESEKFSDPDAHIPDLKKGCCSKCRYIFTSPTDETRHNLKVHGGKRGLAKENKEKGQTNMCKVCSFRFPTRYQLQKHQEQTGHKLKKGRPKDNNE